MLGGFFLIGLALMLGDLLPESLQLLIFAGGVASLLGQVRWRARRDPAADYPYPAPDNPFDSHRR